MDVVDAWLFALRTSQHLLSDSRVRGFHCEMFQALFFPCQHGLSVWLDVVRHSCSILVPGAALCELRSRSFMPILHSRYDGYTFTYGSALRVWCEAVDCSPSVHVWVPHTVEIYFFHKQTSVRNVPSSRFDDAELEELCLRGCIACADSSDAAAWRRRHVLGGPLL